MIDVILVEPRTQKNLGSVARVMKNFEFSQLVLINPKCKVGVEARKTAKHAQEILVGAKIKSNSHLKKYDYLIGTTAILGTDYNIPRNPINAKQAAEKVGGLEKKIKVGLLIGREASGLTNEEIEMCDVLINIPSSKRYPTLNVSHAVSILLYEIFQSSTKIKTNSHINIATKKEKDVIMKFLNKILNQLDFQTKEKKETQKKVWRRIIGKALLTKREAYAVLGFLRKIMERK